MEKRFMDHKLVARLYTVASISLVTAYSSLSGI